MHKPFAVVSERTQLHHHLYPLSAAAAAAAADLSSQLLPTSEGGGGGGEGLPTQTRVPPSHRTKRRRRRDGGQAMSLLWSHRRWGRAKCVHILSSDRHFSRRVVVPPHLGVAVLNRIAKKIVSSVFPTLFSVERGKRETTRAAFVLCSSSANSVRPY